MEFQQILSLQKNKLQKKKKFEIKKNISTNQTNRHSYCTDNIFYQVNKIYLESTFSRLYLFIFLHIF